MRIHAAGLGARIVEFARLTDDDRSGADDEDALDVFPAWHYFASPSVLSTMSLNLSNR